MIKTHRIIEPFELTGTSKGDPAQLPCSERRHLQLHQTAESSVQPDLECLQEMLLSTKHTPAAASLGLPATVRVARATASSRSAPAPSAALERITAFSLSNNCSSSSPQSTQHSMFKCLHAVPIKMQISVVGFRKKSC